MSGINMKEIPSSTMVLIVEWLTWMTLYGKGEVSLHPPIKVVCKILEVGYLSNHGYYKLDSARIHAFLTILQQFMQQLRIQFSCRFTNVRMKLIMLRTRRRMAFVSLSLVTLSSSPCKLLLSLSLHSLVLPPTVCWIHFG